MKKIIFILTIIFFSKALLAQDSRKIFIGKYVGLKKQTNVPGSTFYENNSLAKITFGDSSMQRVYYQDSCSWSPWSYATGIQIANPDSTLREWGAPNYIYGKLYPNDSLYFKYVISGGPTTTTEEFFGFKINTGVGIKEQRLYSFYLNVWPNPAGNKFYLINSSGYEIKKYVLIDVSGKSISLKSDIKNEFDVSDFSEGLYFLQVQTTEGVLTRKIVIQH